MAGKEVTFHEKSINAHGWTGVGYIIVDPDTGAGAYLIEGKGSGGIAWAMGAILGTLVAMTFDEYSSGRLFNNNPGFKSFMLKAIGYYLAISVVFLGILSLTSDDGFALIFGCFAGGFAVTIMEYMGRTKGSGYAKKLMDWVLNALSKTGFPLGYSFVQCAIPS